MAIIIPDFSTYSDDELLSIAATQSQAYIDAYNELAIITENPAQDGVDNFFDTLGAGVEIGVLSLAQESAIALIGTVIVQTDGLQDKFDYAEAFCFEWFHRFYPTNSFVEFKFPDLSQSVQYDNSTDTISVVDL